MVHDVHLWKQTDLSKHRCLWLSQFVLVVEIERSDCDV